LSLFVLDFCFKTLCGLDIHAVFCAFFPQFVVFLQGEMAWKGRVSIKILYGPAIFHLAFYLCTDKTVQDGSSKNTVEEKRQQQ